MKKILAWVLVLVLCLGLFAGCSSSKAPETDEKEGQDAVQQEDSKATAANALAYVKNMYKNATEKTAKDYTRIGVVTIKGKQFEVTWTVDVAEEHVKVVKNDNGTVTIDVNEQSEEDIPYVLTATIINEKGEPLTYSWNHILPAAEDMGAIVDAAFALKSGEIMDHEVTLTGEVTSIKTPYDPDYQNITVVIEVAVRPGKLIECYRLKGEKVSEIAIGDTITVTGTIKNYNGTIEFDTGCICDDVVPGERVQAPEDMKEIVDQAYALGANKSLPYEAKLTGVITQVKDAYDSGYKNISVYIAVEGRESKPILAYRMKGANIDKIGVNDIITVTGFITNYVGSSGHSTIEYTAGCQLVDWIDKAGPVVPSTMQGIVDEAYALGANDTLKYEAKLTGTITKVKTAYDAGYDNVSVEFVVAGREDKPILAYRMKGAGASVIGVGDVITVNGYITNYVGSAGYSTIEYTAGCKLLSYIDNPDPEPEGPPATEGTTLITNLVADTAYKLGMNQVSKGAMYYFNGNLDGEYLGTTSKPADAVDVFVETTDGGYYIYFMKGDVKTYITMEEYIKEGKTYYSAKAVFVTEAPAKCYTWNSSINTLVMNTGNDNFCFGTHGDYTTMSGTSDYYYEQSNAIDVSQFIGRFYTVEITEEEPEAPAENEVKLTVDSLGLTDQSYTSSYTTVDGVDFEWVQLGNYGNGIQVRDKEGKTTTLWNTSAFDAPIKEIRLQMNADKTVYNNADAEIFSFGNEEGDYTYSVKLSTVSGTYEYVITPDAETYTYFFMEHDLGYTFYFDSITIVLVDDGTSEPETPSEPEADSELTVKEAIALGSSKEHNTYTTDKYYVTGEITEVYSTIYGNMKIKDADGNILTIYGTYDATGANRYDAMTVKPVVGDTVTVYGIVGQYNGTAQIKNGWITEHTPGSGTTEPDPEPEPEPEPDEPEDTNASEIVLTVDSLEIPSQTYSSTAATVNGVDFEWTQLGNYGAGIQVRDKEGKTTTLWNTSAFAAPIKEIRLVFNSTKTTYDNADAEIFSFGNAEGEYDYTVKLSTVAGTKEYVITPDAETYTYFYMEHDLGYTFYWDSITIVLVDDGTEPEEPVDPPVEEPDEETITNVKLTVDSLGIPSQTYSSTAATVNGVDFEWTQLGNYDAGIQVRDKEGKTTTLWNTSAFAAPIKEIRLVFNSTKTTYNNADAEIFSFGNAEGEYDYTVKLSTVAGTYEYVITPDAETYTYFYMEHDLGYTFYWDSITIVLVGGEDAEEVEPGEPDEPKDEPETPEVGSVLTIAEAIALGMSKAHNVYTTEKYTVTGEITEVYNTTYGNMKIKDEDGNILTIYGTYSADGSTRYDAMSVKPVVGDTVTIYGIVGQYNNTPQIKNGWITEHTPA